MQQIKRPLSDSFNIYNDSKRLKTQIKTVETDYLLGEMNTSFEDLSNELVYEIFQYFDYFYVYKTFINLNQRFRRLLTDSIHPIKINLSSVSKSTFARYYKTIIIPNTHRINLLRISNIFMYDHTDFPLFHTISKFSQLETLILDNIEEKHLENLLHVLISLPCLSSMIINTINSVENKNNIYRQIIRLPVLKYCKLSFGDWITNSLLPLAKAEYSTTEQFILHNEIYLDQLRYILSYLPQLRHLSFHSLCESRDSSIKIHFIPLFYLTHLSLKIVDVSFNRFEQMIKSFCAPIEVLRINADAEYMNAGKWKKLISSYIPNLRIFDVWFDIVISDTDHQLIIDAQIDQFTSSFWRERRWFFQYLSHQSRYTTHGIFYSTNPYRRTDYTLHMKAQFKICSNNYVTHMKSVDHLHINNKGNVITCVHYFPNVTKLTFAAGVPLTNIVIESTLSHVMCLEKLTQLIIEYEHLYFVKLMDLLSFLPNIRSLKCKSIDFYRKDVMSLQESKIFRSISKKNIITDVTLEDTCSFEKIKLLVTLCPRLQNLTMDIIRKDMERIIRYLLERTNPHTGRLVSLCVMRVSLQSFRELESLIQTEKLPRRCMYKYIDLKLYLWW